MGILRITRIGISGKKAHSLIIFMIALLILIFEVTGLLIHVATKLAEEDVYKQIGLHVKIVPNDEIQNYNEVIITDNMISNLRQMNHVIGCDSYLESFCTPENFNNVKIYKGINPTTQNDQASIPLEEILVSKDQISLMGGLNIKYNESFYKGQNVLINGHFPDQSNEGAIISEQLADANHFKIGDFVTVKCDGTQKETDIEIIGIYQTNLNFEVLETNLLGEEIFHSSPYNIVYTNYSTVNRLENNTCPLIYLNVWIDSPQYVQAVINEIANSEAWQSFKVYNISGIVFNQYAQQLITTGNMSKSLIVLSLLFGGFILIIAMTFFADAYMYETGLYIVLGLKRYKILLVHFLQVLMILITSFLVSVALSPIIGSILNNVLKVDYTSMLNDSTIYSYYTGAMDLQHNFQVAVTPKILIGMVTALVILAVISALIPFLATMRIKPKDILAGKKKG